MWGSIALVIAFFLALLSGEAWAEFKLSYESAVPGQKVSLASPLTRWEKDELWLAETRPGFYEIRMEDPWVYVLPYKFVVDGVWVADPKNPEGVPDGFGGQNSVLKTGFADDVSLVLQPGAVPMEARASVAEDLEGRKHPVVHLRLKTPTGRPVIQMVFADGGDYLAAGAGTVLANLNANPKGPEFRAVFVTPVDRMAEYSFNSKTVEFLCGFVEKGTRSAIVGPSLGGLVAIQAALERPDCFQEAISQSGSFWWEDRRVFSLLESAGKPGTKLWVDVGTFETETMRNVNTEFSDAAKRKGLQVTFRTYPSLHDWTAWKNRLAEALLNLAY
jgi:enterochelin esterase-like enzyme